MNTIFRYLIAIILLSGCTINQKDKNQKFELVYFENGDIKSYSKKEDKGKIRGLDIQFNDRHELERVGHYIDDKPFGYLGYYYKNQQIGLRQYILVGDEPYVNQFWGFDESGNVDRNFSNFFSVETSSDTILAGSEWKIRIKLDCPYFYDGMEVVFGEFDKKFNLIDSTSIRIVNSSDFEVNYEFTFMLPGIEIVRGYINNYEFLNDNTVKRNIRKNFFEKQVVVIK